jgi:CheY-like chemotaxis protein
MWIGMIMLITSSPAGRKCSEVLEQGTGKKVQVVTDLAAAANCLRAYEFSVIVLDQALVDADATEVTSLLHHSGAAIPVYVNLAISGAERLLLEVKAAFRRRAAERTAAMKAASCELRDDLRGAVTGILLSSELALAVPALPAAAQLKLTEVVQLAQRMRRSLNV